MLCVVGVIVYSAREESGISSKWILDHVVPHRRMVGIPFQVCIVLGQAMLWKVWESAQCVCIYDWASRIEMLAYNGVNIPVYSNSVASSPPTPLLHYGLNM